MSVDLRYPIGEFQKQASYLSEKREAFITELSLAPAQLKAALEGLTPLQLETPYRAGGWTVRQVAHHVPDSHANAYIRIKLALTETHPIIKPYDEAAWALLEDTKNVPLDVSVQMLETIHVRLVALLESLTEEQWTRAYQHPVGGLTSVEQALAAYAWHGKNHIAQINQLKQRMGW
jgi:hypothetical protein